MAVSTPEVVIGRGVLGGEILPARAGRARVAIITDPGAGPVATEVLAAVEGSGMTAAQIEVPAGDDAKTLGVAETVFAALNRLGLTRDDTVVAVGGGAITDLGGFVAATYLRGIEAVYCPTTVLGAVDAAIGGKTGVNVDGKNMVGVFAVPSRILIDIGVLEQLPAPLRRQGLAEALKTGLIGDPELVALLEAGGETADLDEIVRRSVAVKSRIVADDFRESGRRMVLNYGHTIGHAVEVAAQLSHGDAVAIGMIAAGHVSTRLAGFDEEERVALIIAGLGLPTRLPAPIDPARLVDLMRLDKKRTAAGLRMVLLERIGVPVVRVVDAATVAEAARAISAE